MIDEMTVGGRYRITLRGGDARGYLEGVLRSAHLPMGMMGNDDGEHPVWIAGDMFDWFLRVDDIAHFERVAARIDPSLLPVLRRDRCPHGGIPSRVGGLTAGSRTRAVPRTPGVRCAAWPRG